MSSARAGGRKWREDLAVHEFIDSSKVAVADLRHRIVLHSVDFGAEMTARAFPDRPDAADIHRRHVREDLREDRTLAQWLAHVDTARLPRLHPAARTLDAAALAEGAARHAGLEDPAPAHAVAELLCLPLSFAAGPTARAVMANAFGIGLVRRVIGPPFEHDGQIVDPALLAEAMVHRLYRTVPPLGALTGALRSSHQAAA